MKYFSISRVFKINLQFLVRLLLNFLDQHRNELCFERYFQATRVVSSNMEHHHVVLKRGEADLEF